MLGSVLGLPGYAAIMIALGFTGLGVFIDLNRINGLGTVFKGCYFAGCVLAVCWVKRRALFGPMVQPPLLLAVAVPGVVLLAGNSTASGGGLLDRGLSIGAPLLNGFPTMAVATGFTLAIGIARYVLQRPPPPPPPPPRSSRPPRSGRQPRDTRERDTREPRAPRQPRGPRQPGPPLDDPTEVTMRPEARDRPRGRRPPPDDRRRGSQTERLSGGRPARRGEYPPEPASNRRRRTR
jgi:uncharacterized protein DUF6542